MVHHESEWREKGVDIEIFNRDSVSFKEVKFVEPGMEAIIEKTGLCIHFYRCDLKAKGSKMRTLCCNCVTMRFVSSALGLDKQLNDRTPNKQVI